MIPGIFFNHNNRNQLLYELNQELNKISDWMIANVLSLNIDKTNFFLFRSTSDDNATLKILDMPIKRKQVIKYLGIQIDHKLKWTNQLAQVKQKVLQGTGMINKVNFLVPERFPYLLIL